MSLDLLREFQIPFEEVGDHARNTPRRAASATRRTLALLGVAARFRPDIILGLHNPYVALVGSLVGAVSIVFVDSEPVRLDRWLTYPFSDILVTPRRFRLDLGAKQVRLDAYKELAYLHPRRFVPDPSVLREAGLRPGERFAILRFVGWNAEHDRGHFGFRPEEKVRLVEELGRRVRLLISSETELSPELAAYRAGIRPSHMHDLLAFADLLVTDSQTMCTEAAVLGTPAVRYNSLVGTMSNFQELQSTYGLVFSYRDSGEAIEKVIELLDTPNLKEVWRSKREALLRDKTDATATMVDLVDRVWRTRLEKGVG